MNELDIALDLYSVGDRLGVVETELGTSGSPSAPTTSARRWRSATLARMGAASYPVPVGLGGRCRPRQHTRAVRQVGRDSYSELARLYDVTVIGVSNVGRLASGPWVGGTASAAHWQLGRADDPQQGPYGEAAEAVVCVEVLPRRSLADSPRRSKPEDIVGRRVQPET